MSQHVDDAATRGAGDKNAPSATRVAVISIIVEDSSSVGRLNALLSEYAAFIIGRMGIPYRARGINVITVALDAPQDEIASLAGKIGSLSGVSAKTAYSNAIFTD